MNIQINGNLLEALLHKKVLGILNMFSYTINNLLFWKRKKYILCTIYLHKPDKRYVWFTVHSQHLNIYF